MCDKCDGTGYRPVHESVDFWGSNTTMVISIPCTCLEDGECPNCGAVLEDNGKMLVCPNCAGTWRAL